VWEHSRVNPNEDPEARIRALEQPLSDAARSSELGTGASYSSGGAYPPPLPPPTTNYTQPNYGQPDYSQWYGGRYGAPPPGTQAFRAWWLVAVAVAVGIMVLGGAIAFFTMKTNAPSSTVTATFGPNPSTRVVPSRTPSKPTSGPSATTMPTPPTVGPNASVSVAGVSQNKTLACDQGSVSVSGVSNTVTITGHCAKVTVSGSSNKVIVDGSDAITASGFGNQVTYHSGDPKVDISGNGNTVQQG
jgi:hypothetical protein